MYIYNDFSGARPKKGGGRKYLLEHSESEAMWIEPDKISANSSKEVAALRDYFTGEIEMLRYLDKSVISFKGFKEVLWKINQ
ncbi:MAG: hypothetical protein AAF696_24455 [Bacteroidota bacterium]